MLRPDGLRVVALAHNSAGPRGPASRPTPVLTVEQPRAIAPSPARHLPT
ncbi:hypothetical protein [Kitasatospora terrestris]